ncbi:MAG TPA: azurin [Gammaproteobacteria bacterium]
MKLRIYIASVLLALSLTHFPGIAAAQNCSVDIDSTDAMQYDKDVIVVAKDCKEFTVNLTHSGKLAENVMGHNWVLSKAEDVQGVATDGMQAGLENDYIKPGDTRVIAHTEIIGGGEKTSVTFPVDKLDPKTVYTFSCSFPGHWSVMRGTLSIK